MKIQNIFKKMFQKDKDKDIIMHNNSYLKFKPIGESQEDYFLYIFQIIKNNYKKFYSLFQRYRNVLDNDTGVYYDLRDLVYNIYIENVQNALDNHNYSFPYTEANDYRELMRKSMQISDALSKDYEDLKFNVHSIFFDCPYNVNETTQKIEIRIMIDVCLLIDYSSDSEFICTLTVDNNRRNDFSCIFPNVDIIEIESMFLTDIDHYLPGCPSFYVCNLLGSLAAHYINISSPLKITIEKFILKWFFKEKSTEEYEDYIISEYVQLFIENSENREILNTLYDNLSKYFLNTVERPDLWDKLIDETNQDN